MEKYLLTNNSIYSIIIAHACFSLQDVVIKSISGRFALHEIIFIRSLFGIFFIFIILRLTNKKYEYIKTTNIKLHLLRGLFIAVTNVVYITSYIVLPFSQAASIFFTAPIFITGFSILIIQEKFGISRWIFVLLGFIGMLFLLKPSISVNNYLILLPVSAAII